MRRISDALVIGLDVGGTSTRATVASLTGERLGCGVAGGGNPTAHGPERAADQLRAALTEALAGLDPGRARAGTIGLAGAGRLLADPAGAAAFARAWHDAGLRCRYAVVGDALVAYASGTARPDGTVLIAGTGAVAALVRGFVLDRVADAHGWLLGDAGSGFWLGREAVRHALADLDAHREPGPLSQSVRRALLGSTAPADPPRATVDALVQAVTRRPPVELAALAPLVIAAYRTGDPAALDIVDTAAGHLSESVARIRPDGDGTPLVLGGGLLAGDTPLATAVGRALRARWPEAPLVRAGDGAAAAAWLAARALPEVDHPAALHRHLVGRGRLHRPDPGYLSWPAVRPDCT